MSTRRLAAIMFTDIAGYTAMMQRDEALALTLRERHREVFERRHQVFRGQIVQYYGDGTLSVFDSAVDAVACAIAMQQEFAQEPKVPLRIGIHTGDIILSETEVIGDGVNVASRVESMAIPGSVLISETVYDNIKNQPEYPSTCLGIFTFKNVEKPLAVYAVEAEDLTVPNPKKLQGKFLKRQSAEPNLWERLPIWARYSLGLVAFLLLGPLIYAPITNLFQADARGGDNFALSTQSIPHEERESMIIRSFENLSGDSTLDWTEVSVPYALSMAWDQNPYLYNLYTPTEFDQTYRELADQARSFRCKYIVNGKVDQTDGNYQVTLDFQPVSSGLDPVQVTATNQALIPLLDELNRKTQQAFKLSERKNLGQANLPISQFLTDSEAAIQAFGTAFTDQPESGNPTLPYFVAALEQDSTFAWAAYELADIFDRYQYEDQQAKKYIAQAMRHQGRLPDLMQARIQHLFYRISDQPEKALALTQLFVEREPENPNYLSALVKESYVQGDYELCLASIERYRQLMGNSTAQMPSQVRCLIMVKRFDEARKYIEEYLVTNPKDEVGWILKAEILTAQENWQEAEKLLMEASLLFPSNTAFSLFEKHLQWRKAGGELSQKGFDQITGDYRMEQYSSYKMTLYDDHGWLESRNKGGSGYTVYPTEDSSTLITAYGIYFQLQRDSNTQEVQRLFMRYPENQGGRSFRKVSAATSEIVDALQDQDYPRLKELFSSPPKDPTNQAYLDLVQQHLAWREAHPQAAGLEKFEGDYRQGTYRFKAEIQNDQLFFGFVDNSWSTQLQPLLQLSETDFMTLHNLVGYYRFKLEPGQGVVGYYGLNVNGPVQELEQNFAQKLP
ncbi:MAG: adenylate/guanylate cyclase domain-containing protein [Bacteroidota bacterium]